MNILVTGGAGFIGSHLGEGLLADGHRVTCLDDLNDFYDPRIKKSNLMSCLSHRDFQFVQGDIRDRSLVQKVCEQNGFDAIYHLAARAGVRPSIQEPALYADVNVTGTVNVLEAARKTGVKKFFFASSSSVYGNNAKVPFTESDPLDQLVSPYAATKAAGELLCQTYHQLYRLPVVAFRFFTVYGPRQRPEMAIHLFTRALFQHQPIRLFGDGTTSRDYTYIDDIVAGIIKALNTDFGFEIVNLGNSHPVTLRELVSLLEGATGKQAVIEWQPAQPGDVERTFSDITKASRLIGYGPKTPLADGLGRFVEWYTKNYV